MPTNAVIGAGARANIGRIRNLLEIDAVPDALSFFVRYISNSAARFSVRRLGSLQSTSFSLPCTPGQHWLSRDMDLVSIDDAASRMRLYTRQFHGLRPMRLLYVRDAPCEPIMLEAFRPDIILHDGCQAAPPGFTTQSIMIGNLTAELAFANMAAEEAFEDAHAMFEGGVQRRRDMRSCIVDVDDLMVWDGFYQGESNATHSWIWTGAMRTARFLMPVVAGQRLRLSTFLFASRTPLTPEDIVVSIDGAPAVTHFYPEYQKFETDFSYHDRGPSLQVSIQHGKLEATADGSRDLGLALHKVRLEAL